MKKKNKRNVAILFVVLFHYIGIDDIKSGLLKYTCVQTLFLRPMQYHLHPDAVRLAQQPLQGLWSGCLILVLLVHPARLWI